MKKDMDRTSDRKLDKKQQTLQLEIPRPPDFRALLEKPIVGDRLPADFQVDEEAPHLHALWDELPGLHHYDFYAFVHAGGSGLVFKVRKKTAADGYEALKIVRAKLLKAGLPDAAAQSLSPVSDRELRALAKLSHPHVVHLYEAHGNDRGVLAISTTYVDNPKSIDSYIHDTLEKVPRGTHPFSPRRLEKACEFLVAKCLEIAYALLHMHNDGMYHFDIKPANILISGKHVAVLTDLGACIHYDDLKGKETTRVHFTWTYAHNEIRDLLSDPGSITGGLKASAEVVVESGLEKYDLFAFGRMLQECLAILEGEFGERAHAAYGFRYLHLIACLLLDGKNAPSGDGIRVERRDGRRFMSDTALDFPTVLFSRCKITNARELVDRLKRFSKEYSWYAQIPELDPWQPHLVNTGFGAPAPFTDRVAKVLGHPIMRRLKFEAQLGWIKEVFPGATHNRWSHTIGVFSATVQIYNSLLADPENPAMRILLNVEDVLVAMISALLHDLGQVSFGHDMEAACPYLYNHEDIVERLLDEKYFGDETLRDTIVKSWPNVDMGRVTTVLSKKRCDFPIDGVAQDIVGGPIDADKLDYIQRDSVGCGVSYGRSIDVVRFLQALSVSATGDGRICRVNLAYKAKGAAAIEAVLLARYQMYCSVYWHHTFRCIQALYSHAAALTFAPLKLGRRKLRHGICNADIIRELFYEWVICGKSTFGVKSSIESSRKQVPQEFFDEAPPILSGERAIEFVWKFADDNTRRLLERLGCRDLYRRIYEIKVSDFGDRGDYSALKNDLEADKRPDLASQIEERLMKAIYKGMADRGPRESVAENEARQRYSQLELDKLSKVVIDFPTRGVPDEDNVPAELGDPARKYISGRSLVKQGRVFHVVRRMLTERATLRVFAASELHELVVRYLDPSTVEACVGEVIPRVRAIR